MQTLILGGARSGKSRYAETLAKDSGLAVCYIATATAHDHEMQSRIHLHQQRRPAQWRTIEEPIALAARLREVAADHQLVLVDCLTLWLTNLLCSEDPEALNRESTALLAVLPTLPGRVIFVSNEVGQGVVPMGELTRRYVDEAGYLHQRLAEQMRRVVLVVAGLPLILKGE